MKFKSIFILFLILFGIVIFFSKISAATGDLNSDNKVDFSDAFIVIKWIINLDRTNSASDVNGDGVVNIFDIVQVGVLLGKQYGNDTAVPIITAGKPNVNLSATATHAVLSVTTNERATCKHSTSSGTNYSLMTQFNKTGGIFHATNLTNLSNGTAYNYYVKCQDETGNLNDTDYPISFNVGNVSVADTQAPTQPTNLVATNISSSQINLSWTASTDNVAVAGYMIYRCTGGVCTPTVNIANVTSGTVYANSGLTINTTYTYAVSAYDAANNEGTKSSFVNSTTFANLTYITTFSLTENPISEGGVWTNGNTTGINWSNVQTNSSHALGTKFNAGPPYDDSLAILSGYNQNQSAEGVVYKEVGYVPSANHEVELLLRFSITAGDAHGYEVLWQSNGGYSQVVRWNGPLNNFTMIQASANLGTPANGDVVKATIIGNNISVYKNGVLRSTITDSTWTTGNPGVGIWARSGSNLSSYGWDSFTATSLD